jgi:hypothetical protein
LNQFLEHLVHEGALTSAPNFPLHLSRFESRQYHSGISVARSQRPEADKNDSRERVAKLCRVAYKNVSVRSSFAPTHLAENLYLDRAEFRVDL